MKCLNTIIEIVMRRSCSSQNINSGDPLTFHLVACAEFIMSGRSMLVSIVIVSIYMLLQTLSVSEDEEFSVYVLSPPSVRTRFCPRCNQNEEMCT